jgi:hypothetical protein
MPFVQLPSQRYKWEDKDTWTALWFDARGLRYFMVRRKPRDKYDVKVLAGAETRAHQRDITIKAVLQIARTLGIITLTAEQIEHLTTSTVSA